MLTQSPRQLQALRLTTIATHRRFFVPTCYLTHELFKVEIPRKSTTCLLEGIDETLHIPFHITFRGFVDIALRNLVHRIRINGIRFIPNIMASLRVKLHSYSCIRIIYGYKEFRLFLHRLIDGLGVILNSTESFEHQSKTFIYIGYRNRITINMF